jgi:hypothetical protein
MKILINTQYLIKRYFVIIFSLLWLSCDDDERAIDYAEDAAINARILDPFLQVTTGFVPFEVGTEKYDIQFNVVNGVDALSKVKLYGSFYDAESRETSNEVLFGEYNVTSPERTVIKDSFTYDELRGGLTVDGGPLPASDEDIFPGSGWSFRFEGDYASGKTLPLVGQINMVLSKYAGIYKVSNSTYMRIQVDPVIFPGEGVAHWDGEEVFIGFVDENTLSYNDAWGYFPTPGCSWEFNYNEDGKITDIVLSDGIVCASAAATLATCATPDAFKNLSTYLNSNLCVESNVIIDNDVTGEHVIKLTYGYVGAGGVRQFTETLTKVVD